MTTGVYLLLLLILKTRAKDIWFSALFPWGMRKKWSNRGDREGFYFSNPCNPQNRPAAACSNILTCPSLETLRVIFTSTFLYSSFSTVTNRLEFSAVRLPHRSDLSSSLPSFPPPPSPKVSCWHHCNNLIGFLAAMSLLFNLPSRPIPNWYY